MKITKTKKPLESLIITVRGHKVLLDLNLAEIYGVETRALNQAVKRNQDRFPDDFLFELTRDEILRISQTVTSLPNLKFSKQVQAFTEHGALMAATVLNSPEAVAMSVFVVRAFMQMREQLAANAAILKRLAEIDKTLLEHDSALRTIWTKLQPLLAPPPEPPRRRIGFNQDDAP
jgi:ORF6N domain